MNINNQTLKKLYVRYQRSPGVESPSEIIERIGCPHFLFNYRSPGNSSHYYYPAKFLCYEDSTFGLKQFTNYDCNFSNPAALNENKVAHAPVKLYPNPTKDHITIEGENLKDATLIVSDAQGRQVKQVVFKTGVQEEIPVSNLPNGLYFVHLTNKFGNFCLKFAKQE